MNKPKSTNQDFNKAIEVFKQRTCASIRDGSFVITPDFAKKLDAIKNDLQKKVDEPIVSVVRVSDFNQLSKSTRRDIGHIRLKI